MGSNCFHGMTLYNDMILDGTEVANISAFAFAGVTVNRDFNWTGAVRFRDWSSAGTLGVFFLVLFR